MSYNNNINPGSPPLLWSNVQEAFVKINENFDILVATIGNGSGLAPLAFGSLETSVSPSSNNLYQIGTSSNRWKAVYTNEYANNSLDAANGLWLGNAQVRGIGGVVDLPFGSTIDGELIIDPDKDAFKFVSVSGQDDIVADGFSSAFTVEGNGITVTTDPLTSKLIFTSTSVKTVTGGDAITVTGTQNLTVTNTGVKRLTNTTTLPSGRTQGAGINVSAETGNILLTNTGVLSIEAGSAALVVSTDAATGIVTITNAAPAGNAFRFAVVNGLSGSPIEANSVNGILNFVSGQGITLSQNIVSDTITFAVNPVFDLKGSVFGDDSSKLVDAVEGKFYGDLYGDVTANTLTGTLTTSAQPSITSVGTLSSLSVTGSVAGNSFTGNIFTNLIDSADSSAITVTPATIFSTNVTVDGNITLKDNVIFEKRLSISELEGSGEVLAIYSDWAKDTGISIVSYTGSEAVTLSSNRVVGVVTGFGPAQKEWVFDTSGQIQFPDSRFQTGAAISIAELKVLVAAAATYADFQTAIAALA